MTSHHSRGGTVKHPTKDEVLKHIEIAEALGADAKIARSWLLHHELLEDVAKEECRMIVNTTRCHDWDVDDNEYPSEDEPACLPCRAHSIVAGKEKTDER